MKIFRKVTGVILAIALIFSVFPTMNVNADDNNSYDTYEGSFSSSSDIKTYNLTLDFATMDTGAICLVKTGKTAIQMVVADADGNTVKTVNAINTNARRWVFIDKPSTDATTVTYTVTLTPINYDAEDTSFRIMAGNKNDTEEMISGQENAVYLDTYTEVEGNQFFTYYTPDNYESWYKFSAPSYSKTTFTLLTKDKDIRFRIVDVDNISGTPLYDSANDATAHRTKCCSSYGYAEKTKLNNSVLTAGNEYYLIIYSSTPSGNTSSFVQNTLNVTVGKPNMLSGNATYYSTSSITGTKSSYSSTATISANTLPSTAVVDSVKMQSSTSGVTMSKIADWRVKTPTETSWRSSSVQTLTVGYQKDSDSNISAVGNWKFSFKASSYTSSLTMKPGIYISYYYEMGD